jgi:hypothetical protein
LNERQKERGRKSSQTERRKWERIGYKGNLKREEKEI